MNDNSLRCDQCGSRLAHILHEWFYCRRCSPPSTRDEWKEIAKPSPQEVVVPDTYWMDRARASEATAERLRGLCSLTSRVVQKCGGIVEFKTGEGSGFRCKVCGDVTGVALSPQQVEHADGCIAAEYERDVLRGPW